VDWDERFSIEDYLFGAEPAQALVKLEHYLIPQGDTLVIADGEGRNSVYLASKGFKVTATDASTVANVKAKALAASRNVAVDYQVEDFFDIDWSAKQYDNIVGIFFQFIPPDKIKQVLTALRTAIKKGGTLLIHGYTPQQIELATGGPKDVSLMYTKELFEDMFENVEILVNNEYQMQLTEGSGHNGPSALIDFVAQC
jgi:cyclopropane fatty-acyl-phospholipid synthase-like methyltransferase|tara:strand:+ start:198 stop:791 length:594 start_codon:yes stop_codon:yes gene_type:complete